MVVSQRESSGQRLTFLLLPLEYQQLLICCLGRRPSTARVELLGGAENISAQFDCCKCYGRKDSEALALSNARKAAILFAAAGFLSSLIYVWYSAWVDDLYGAMPENPVYSTHPSAGAFTDSAWYRRNIAL